MPNTTSGSRPAKRARKSTTPSGGQGRDFPDLIYAVASPPSVGGTSLFTPGLVPSAETVDAFVSA